MPKRPTVSMQTLGELPGRALDLLGLFMSMYLSELLVENIIFGGAVYIMGMVWTIYARLYSQRNIRLLSAQAQSVGIFIFILAALLTAAIVFFYPYIQSKPTSLLLTITIVGVIAQQIVTDTVAERMTYGTRKRVVMLASLHLAFLAGYVIFFVLNSLVLAYQVPEDIHGAYLLVVLLSLARFALQVQKKPAAISNIPHTEGAKTDVTTDTLMGVHSYRVYNKMAVNTFVAINLSAIAFICYMRFLPYTGVMASLVMLVIWMAFIALMVALGFFLLRKRYQKHDRSAIFLVGLLFWAAAAYSTLRGTWSDPTISAIVNSAMMGIALSCMLSIILEQSYEMKTIVELGVGHIDEGAYHRNTMVMIDWSMLLSYLLLLVMLVVASFIMDGKLDELAATQGMQDVLKVIMLALPMVFVIASMVYSLLQPLDKNYIAKLKKFTRQSAEGAPDIVMEKRLEKILVSNYPRKIAVKVLRPLIRPFVPCRVYGKEFVDTSNGPVIFICNHLELYGPMVSVLHSPFPLRPWVIHSMLEKDVIAEQMQPGADKIFSFLPEKWRRSLTRTVAPLLMYIIESTDPIPVHRGTVRGLINTIQLSAEALAYDDNILIFPEVDYKETGVGEFFTGFVQVAKTYYRLTQKCAVFCPMYIDKKRRRMTYGESIQFDPSNTNAVEVERLVGYLQAKMNELAEVPPTEEA